MTVSFLTLGCKVNQYESEALSEALALHGIATLPFGEKVDITVINTCAVTTEGERKARQMVRRAVAVSPGACIVVMGCASQLHPGSFEKIKGVHYILGNGKKMKALELILAHFQDNEQAFPLTADDSFALTSYERMEIEKSERTRAYIKIEDGCDSKCAYCIIKTARGPVRSRPMAEVLREAERLVAKGYREIVLTGIEISAYGKDTGTDLPTLLEALDEIKGLGRVRLGSLDPAILCPDFCERLAKIKCLCHHFHLSLQSGCSKTLAAMRRKNNAQGAEASIAHMRSLMPDATFTADIIVGFPGESDEDFLITCSFLERIALLDCHIFAFSPRPGTEAAEMKEQIDSNTKAFREKALAKIIVRTKEQVLHFFLRKSFSVLFEENKDGYAQGHTANFLEVAVKTHRVLHNTEENVLLERIENGKLIGSIVPKA